jgi:hypothetical protein
MDGWSPRSVDGRLVLSDSDRHSDIEQLHRIQDRLAPDPGPGG